MKMEDSGSLLYLSYLVLSCVSCYMFVYVSISFYKARRCKGEVIRPVPPGIGTGWVVLNFARFAFVTLWLRGRFWRT